MITPAPDANAAVFVLGFANDAKLISKKPRKLSSI